MKARTIKVCGMVRPHNVREVRNLDVDYVGFIFYEKSPRYCLETVGRCLEQLSWNLYPVAVTVNMDEDEILRLKSEFGFGFFQLHGEESPEMCRRLSDKGLVVWKAMPISDEASLEALEPYHGNVDQFVFDTKTSARGGSGEKFDWSLLDKYQGPTFFRLGGGIRPDDAPAILQIENKYLYGVDLNSGFEKEPGLKNVKLLSKFISEFKR